MPTLQVRELPEQIYQKLKQQAELKHRTLTQQAIITLARGLRMPLNPKKRRKILLKRIKSEAQRSKDCPLPDPIDLIKEDRRR